MEKFVTLNVQHLRLENLSGLCFETVELATPQIAILDAVGVVRLQQLTAASDILASLLDQERSSILTPEIAAEDRLCDALFAETKRTVSTAVKSSIPEKAEAGRILTELLKPFWNINNDPMLSQVKQLRILEERFSPMPIPAHAAQVLGIDGVMEQMFRSSDRLYALYNARLDETSHREKPSATSVKNETAVAYDTFCSTIENTLSAMPTEALQVLFNAMNDVRRKYVTHLPTKLDPAHTSVAPMDKQAYTGHPVTPLPRVFYQNGKETVELVLGKDFTVTYRNNVEVGEAKIIIHGKGKYTGSHETTFYIAR
jgi:hypothetical protein